MFGIVLLFLLSGCADSVAEPEAEIIGCNTLSYDGCEFSDVGCEEGILSFDYEVTIDDTCYGNFHIECEAGCIASADVISSDSE